MSAHNRDRRIARAMVKVGQPVPAAKAATGRAPCAVKLDRKPARLCPDSWPRLDPVQAARLVARFYRKLRRRRKSVPLGRGRTAEGRVAPRRVEKAMAVTATMQAFRMM